MYWLTGIIGIAVLFAPFVFGYAENIPLLWASVILAIILLSIATEYVFYGDMRQAVDERRKIIL
ncbi:MAG TPA: hypothetical protein VLF20_03705 [Patescibacteria group bacterium]|nr:hypothetical protein [Patescibacteria group bacterium]